jgi:hypothetical protein
LRPTRTPGTAIYRINVDGLVAFLSQVQALHEASDVEDSERLGSWFRGVRNTDFRRLPARKKNTKA